MILEVSDHTDYNQLYFIFFMVKEGGEGGYFAVSYTVLDIILTMNKAQILLKFFSDFIRINVHVLVWPFQKVTSQLTALSQLANSLT